MRWFASLQQPCEEWGRDCLSLVAFGLVTFSVGLYLWHRQGPHFGLGEAKGRVDARSVFVSAGLCLALIGAELARNVR